MKSNTISEIFLGREHKQMFAIIYTIIIGMCFFYFCGMACGKALFYLLN